MLFIAQSYLCQCTIQLVIIAFHLINIFKSLYKFYPNFLNSLGILLISVVPWGKKHSALVFLCKLDLEDAHKSVDVLLPFKNDALRCIQ